MTSIRPVDLPELRAESMLWQDSHGHTMMPLWREALRGRNEGSAAFAAHEAEYVRLRWRHEITVLGSAPLFYVASDMVDLARVAASSLPSFTVRPDDMPALSGLMVLGRPLEDHLPVGNGLHLPVRALLWSIIDGVVTVTPYIHRDDLLDMHRLKVDRPIAHYDSSTLACFPQYMFGSPFGEAEWKDAAGWTTADELFPFLISTWLLMQQPLSEATEIEPDRAVKKRLRRSGQEPKPVRVIELRRPKSSGAHGDGESNYQHQWIVRGHWRNHWHPKRQVHRPVWIAPHVKGPEGAPMIGGEKVYMVRGDRTEAPDTPPV